MTPGQPAPDLPQRQPSPSPAPPAQVASLQTDVPERVRRSALDAAPRRSGRGSGRAAGVQQALPVQLRSLGQPGRNKHVPVTASCGGCDRRWTEENATHCRGCHGHWPDVVGFDEHLPGCPTYVPIAPPARGRARKAS